MTTSPRTPAVAPEQPAAQDGEHVETLRAMLLEHPAPNFTAERAALEAAIVALQRQPADATEEMCDAVRYLLIGMEKSGQTFGGIRRHCELSGMDTSHWPVWTQGRDDEHFNKSARAALIWHCMSRAAIDSARAEGGGDRQGWAAREDRGGVV